ncbi:hypothetical protein CLV51_107179 [Chitinophaga niastensis]|uniref:Uncharacterized protein n=1 Tax=Chitinophaga niastensis TaxID=536980 RepID=A0A2P8HCB3_CHINA|nr:hypothetical protein CLV51_107179 [Chitinophaga niastensis]
MAAAVKKLISMTLEIDRKTPVIADADTILEKWRQLLCMVKHLIVDNAATKERKWHSAAF